MANGIGITIERTARRTPCFAHIDLRKYGEELRPFFESKGIKLEEEIKFTEKLNNATREADNKIGKIGDINSSYAPEPTTICPKKPKS